MSGANDIGPLLFEWNGDAMVPRSPGRADRQFAVHETYVLAPVEERSQANHNHFFAAVSEGWKNLPEGQAERFPTSEHLRKWALVKAGYCDERSIVAASKAEALRVAAFVRPMDEYAVVVVSESVVRVYTAKTQKVRAMGKKDFQASKDRVLDIIAELVGVTADQLSQEAGQSA